MSYGRNFVARESGNSQVAAMGKTTRNYEYNERNITNSSALPAGSTYILNSDTMPISGVRLSQVIFAKT